MVARRYARPLSSCNRSSWGSALCRRRSPIGADSTLVEVEDAVGSKLTIRLGHASPVDVSSVLATFRGAGVLPFYETMSGRCAGTPGNANYGNPECAPAAERFYDRSSSRGLDYCGCDSLTLHRRLMEQRGHIPASPVP